MKSEIIKIYTKKEEIGKIVERLKDFDFDSLKKHPHFEFSVLEKVTDLDILESNFTKFGLIKSVEFRRNEKGQEHYSFNYELEDKTFMIISLVFDTNPPTIINGFHANRNYKNFEASLRKRYQDKFS